MPAAVIIGKINSKQTLSNGIIFPHTITEGYKSDPIFKNIMNHVDYTIQRHTHPKCTDPAAGSKLANISRCIKKAATSEELTYFIHYNFMISFISPYTVPVKKIRRPF